MAARQNVSCPRTASFSPHDREPRLRPACGKLHPRKSRIEANLSGRNVSTSQPSANASTSSCRDTRRGPCDPGSSSLKHIRYNRPPARAHAPVLAHAPPVFVRKHVKQSAIDHTLQTARRSRKASAHPAPGTGLRDPRSAAFARARRIASSKKSMPVTFSPRAAKEQRSIPGPTPRIQERPGHLVGNARNRRLRPANIPRRLARISTRKPFTIRQLCHDNPLTIDSRLVAVI